MRGKQELLEDVRVFLIGHEVRPGEGGVQRVRFAGIGLTAELRGTDLDGHGSPLSSGITRDGPLDKTEITGTVGRERAGKPRLLPEPSHGRQAIVVIVAKGVQSATRTEGAARALGPTRKPPSGPA